MSASPAPALALEELAANLEAVAAENRRILESDLDTQERRTYIEGRINAYGFAIRRIREAAAAARLRAAETRPQWQPMETAPKDGTLVLLANVHDAADWPIRCRRWQEDHWRGHDAEQATHWMPLPAAPALPGETPVEPQDRPTFEFSCPCCGDPFALTKELDVDIHSGATYRCALCDGKVIFDAIAADKYATSPAVAPVASYAPSQPDLMRLLEKIQQRMEYARRAQCFDEKHAARYFDALTGIDIDMAEALATPPSRDREEPR